MDVCVAKGSAALADLGDGGDSLLLCLDTADRPILVPFPGDILTDPKDDLNPATRLDVTPPH